MEKVLLLNGDYSYLNIISVRRALCLLVKGKCQVLKSSEKEIKCVDGKCIKIPLVMRLIKIIRMLYKNKIPYSKKNIFIRDGNKCVYCGHTDNLTIDHVIPLSRGGKTTFENCVTACTFCNNEKRNRTPSEANMFLRKQPFAPTISEFLRIKIKNTGVSSFMEELFGE